MSDIKMEDMPQMPETRGFLEIFRDMLRLDLIGQEWGETFSPAVVAGIALAFLSALGAGVYAAWYNWTYEEDGILRKIFQKMVDCFRPHEDSYMDRVKRAFGYKQD